MSKVRLIWHWLELSFNPHHFARRTFLQSGKTGGCQDVRSARMLRLTYSSGRRSLLRALWKLPGSWCWTLLEVTSTVISCTFFFFRLSFSFLIPANRALESKGIWMREKERMEKVPAGLIRSWSGETESRGERSICPFLPCRLLRSSLWACDLGCPPCLRRALLVSQSRVLSQPPHHMLGGQAYTAWSRC